MQFSEEALKYLNLGISSEIAAYVFYKKAADILWRDKEIKEALLKIAAEEKNHFLALEEVYDRNVRSEMWAPYKDILNKKGLPDIDELIQDTHKELLAKIAKITRKKEVLEMGLSLEKDAVALYSDASANSSHPEVKQVFDYLIRFEENHVRLFESELAAL
ncbi:MAG: ferritin family protein [Deltaproteobacteria bacterium]|nr:ferritin family protein [Deltaproteobacteria bacterium]